MAIKVRAMDIYKNLRYWKMESIRESPYYLLKKTEKSEKMEMYWTK